MTPQERAQVEIESVRLKVGMEIHVELSTRSKMFTRAPNGASVEFEDAQPNSLIDPVVLALPGALPVMNRSAVEMSMMVGLALSCEIAPFTKWDRKSYFYPDLPKAYQISQYDMPLCFDGAVDVYEPDAKGFPDLSKPSSRIGIIRAHLEEDAGKLLHEAPGGGSIDGSIVDLNRAGTPLLEIVTQPDFVSSDQCVSFARALRATCRFLGVTEGVMQKGHMRFEPNINCVLTTRDGRTITTPIVEVKNLNSFRALKGAIDFERRVQAERWRETGIEFAPGTKSTRGWDDDAQKTLLQREKEEAEDYRYFPDPDLLPVRVSDEWRAEVAQRVPELPLARMKRYAEHHALSGEEAWLLAEERATSEFYDRAVDAAVGLNVPRDQAGKSCATLLLQHGAKRANELQVPLTELGITPEQLAQIAHLRAHDKISAGASGELFNHLCERNEPSATAESLGEYHGLMLVRDDAALDRWCDEVIAANGPIAQQVRDGKTQAVGRLIGEVMKKSQGAADAKQVRDKLLEKLS